MTKRYLASSILFSFLAGRAGAFGCGPRRIDANIQVKVELVQLNVAVMDHKGSYITGLQSSRLRGHGGRHPAKNCHLRRRQRSHPNVDRRTGRPPKPWPADGGGAAPAPDGSSGLRSAMMGANVFVLFDTSNYMYRGFVFAQDAIADFVRSLEGPDRIAFYSYSRDLSRAAMLTPDRTQVLRGVRSTVAGDDAALYNALLLTVKDAGQISGRKVVVVFSNGPDNSSMVPPEDVAELAQSKGIPIYMISTREAKLEPVSATVFERMAAATGGEAYFAKTWRDQQKAFAAIRNDLAHLYTISYYPQPNPNHGWRAITVKIPGERGKSVRIRTRDGYRPLPNVAPPPERASVNP